MTKTLEQRFWEKVRKPDLEDEAGCWLWVGTSRRSNRDLYGYIRVEGKAFRAHRLSYEMAKGPIPAEYDIDHLCRNTLCVRPDHLEAVPHRVNILRGRSPLAENGAKTHCIHGHEFTPENTYERPSGGRDCRICRAEKIKKWKQENSEKLLRERDEARSLLRDLEEAAIAFWNSVSETDSYPPASWLEKSLRAVAQARKEQGW